MSQSNLSLCLLEVNTYTYTQILTSSGKQYTDSVMPYSSSQLVIYCGNKLHYTLSTSNLQPPEHRSTPVMSHLVTIEIINTF